VRALTAAALAEPGLPAEARVRLEQISGQTEWLAEMVHEFLHETAGEDGKEDEAPEAGRKKPSEAAVHPDVACVVNQVIQAGQMTWKCNLIVTSPEAPVRCALNLVPLRRVVSNVISNAVRAAGPSGLVTVRIWRSKGQVRVVVEDTGPGFGNIPSGLGLGLAWVARTIVRLGGRIECGRGAGGGACVSLWVPCGPESVGWGRCDLCSATTTQYFATR
jgi:signal transduction histidine kinase